METLIQEDLTVRLGNMISGFKISSLEKKLSDLFDMPSPKESVEYLGTLNKTDIMF